MVENKNTGGDILLDIFAPCGKGHPGGAGCNRTTTSKCVAGNCAGSAKIQAHPTVTVNPCTHDAIVAYRSGSNVNLKFYDASATLKGSIIVTSPGPLGQSSVCTTRGGRVPRCGLGTGDCEENGDVCLNTADKVQVATNYDPGSGKCYAYVAYDAACASGGSNHMRAHFDIVNITNESALTVSKRYISSACSTSTDDDFESISTAHQYTTSVGWFYYHQPSGDACHTTFTGQTDTNLGLSSMTPLGTIGSSFPAMVFVGSGGGGGLGDYVGIVKRGIPGGDLIPSWSQPVQTSASCVSCQGTQYSLAIFGADITP